MDLALRLFALSAALLQFLVAVLLVRRGGGPFRWLLAAGLLFNGIAAARLAVSGTAPIVPHLLVDFADGATGPVLLGCAALAFRFPDHDRRDRRGWATLAAVATMILALALQLALVPERAGHATYDLLHTLPALLGLSGLGIALSWHLRRARADQAAEAGLLALAFLATLGENAIAAVDQLNSGIPLDRLARPVGQLACIAAALATVVLLAWPARRNGGWRVAVLVAMACGMAAYLSYFNRVGAAYEPVFFVLYLGTTLSFYVLRPVALGLAYARSRTLWGLHDLGLFLLLLVAGKALAVALLGTPPTQLRFQDLSVLAGVMLLLPLAAAGSRGMLGVRESRRDEPAAHERLGRYLLDMHHRNGPGWSASKRDIELGTGITENNLAAAIRRLERDLDDRAEPGTLVLEQRVGVRGRKRYRLSPAAAAALTA